MTTPLRRATPLEQLRELKRGAIELLPEDEFLKKLESSYDQQKPLVIKFGADPSRPDIHLGHTVVINKLKLLQDFGHRVQFLIGDFTAQIGDPTGRSKTRQQLSAEEVKKNSQTYQEQIFKILDPARTQIVYNSAWLDPLKLTQFLQVLMTTTVVQLLAREDFSERLKTEQPIYLHEFLYPILQGYDSVAMKADLELGGSDQRFNLLMGRWLQKAYQLPQQAILLMPLLEGLDGVQKMSKSYDNYISLTDTPKDMFGKVMSISDPLMHRYYELVSMRSTDEVERIRNEVQEGVLHPMIAKKQLAEEIVDIYHGAGKGSEERQRFETLFSKKESHADLPVHSCALAWFEGGVAKVNLINFLAEKALVKSKSEAKRLLQQNAIRVDGQVVSEEWFVVQPETEYLIRAGKLVIVKLKPTPPTQSE